ncbi:DapH/DapD/GlmU-related protein [Kosakonia cowanii]|jgi:lipopolysaccharide O-acetyltransferase|uniref:acyltransferase n=1 Tax=Kosakonia cowanii TaxID=208223 RepID=UPI0028E42C18|nr:acyltransferase [uncultured Kosakonia sp.]
MKNERLLILLLRVFLFPYNKIRNCYYALALGAKNIIVGKALSLRGSRNVSIGRNVNLGNQTWIDAIGSGKIIIGDDVSFSQNVHVAAASHVVIGDGCLVGSDVLITDHDHSFETDMLTTFPKNRPLRVKGPTVLGKNIWLSDNVKILSGVTLGNNSVVAANSVVTRSFPENVLLAGNPAVVIRQLK